jgi:hypothetical protein
MKERQDELGEVVGGTVVGIVGARDDPQLTVGKEPGGRLGPGHGHDRLAAAPGDQHRHLDHWQFALDGVAQGMGQGPGHPVRPGVADVAEQDGQLQRVLAGGVAQPAEDLPGGGAGRWIHGRADQDQAAHPGGMAHGQVDGNLATEGVAEDRHRRQPGRLEPGGQVVGVLSDVQHPAWVAAEAEAGQVDHVDRVVGGQPGRQRHQVAMGDGQAVDQDQRRGVVGAAEGGAVVDVDPSDRLPAALEPPGRTGGAGRQPISVQGGTRAASDAGHPLLGDGGLRDGCVVLCSAAARSRWRWRGGAIPGLCRSRAATRWLLGVLA